MNKLLNVTLKTSNQILQDNGLQNEIKRILISNNNEFIPSLYDRIEFQGTLEEKVDFRIKERIQHGYHYILAFLEAKLVGFTEFLPGDVEVQNQNLYAINVGTSAIDKDHHGQGVAKALYAFLDDLAINSNVDAVLRSTWSQNGKQLRLYERFGYKEIERIKNFRGENNDLIKFCKFFK